MFCSKIIFLKEGWFKFSPLGCHDKLYEFEKGFKF